jgi:hypothetical protein
LNSSDQQKKELLMILLSVRISSVQSCETNVTMMMCIDTVRIVVDDGFSWNRESAAATLKRMREKLQQAAAQHARFQQQVLRQKAKDRSIRLGSMTVQRTGALGGKLTFPP